MGVNGDSAARSTGERARPWIALVLPAIAWMSFEYGAGISLRPACHAIGTWLGPAWGGLSLLVCLAAALIAWPLARAGGGLDAETRPWLARVALVGAGIFSLAIGFQTVATLIVPSCAH